VTASHSRRARADRSPVTVHWSLALTLLVSALAGCGVETATTAATGAAIKKTEVDQGKKTLEQSQQRVEQAAQQVQQRAEQGRESADK
jgi:TolA-binding protein